MTSVPRRAPDSEGDAAHTPIPRLRASRDETENRSCGCEGGEAPGLQMIDSKPHSFFEISPDIYLSAIVCSAFSFPSGRAGTRWSIYAQVPLPEYLLFFFLLLRRCIKIGRGASGCAAPIGAATYRRAPSVSCILLFKREKERCRCWCHPTASWQPQFEVWQAPGTRILAHISLRQRAWLVNCCQLLLAICLHIPLQAFSPSAPRDVEPASRIFFMTYSRAAS